MKLCVKGFIMLLGLGVFGQRLVAQSFNITGKILAAEDNKPLAGANIALFMLSDSSTLSRSISDTAGNFNFISVPSKKYGLRITNIGYTALWMNITVTNQTLYLGNLKLSLVEKDLESVNVIQIQARVVQKQDTTEYNASAFKTNPDATAEDLITKMPGITSENGTIKANGQEVKKVLMDGTPYFGDDVTLALKNIPSDMVSTVQVYKSKSDQSAFTGFDDGNSKQTLNFITKKDRNKGVFGKVYGGAGYLTDLHYSAGFNLNWFGKNMRLSAIGMSNNVNQQNFSFADILGVTNTSAPQFAGMCGGGPPPGAPKAPPPGASDGPGANIQNYLTSQQGGIATTRAAGINYTDVWGKKEKVKVSGSYFFNWAKTIDTSSLVRKYYSSTDTTQYYTQQSQKTSTNINQRANLRLEYKMDDDNTLIVTPSFTYQSNNQNLATVGQNSYNLNEILSNVNSEEKSNSYGFNLSTDALYQHKFKKPRRTLSINISNKYSASTNQYNLISTVQSPISADSTYTNQQTRNVTSGYTLGANLNYTEPLGKNGLFQLEYNPTLNWNNSNKSTLTPDSSGRYVVEDSTLSNRFNNQYFAQKVGIGYMFRKKKISFNIGADYQYASLTDKEAFPLGTSTQRSFNNILPNAMLFYNISYTSSLRIMYRASTTAPTILQLQEVIDNTNPTQLTTGNPDLKQSVTHSSILDYHLIIPKTGQTFFAMTMFNYTGNYIGNSVYTATSDTTVQPGITLASGSQITKPVNLNGDWSLNSFLGYGIPVSRIKCNLNFNTGVNISSTPGLVNGVLNSANTYALNAGFFLSSNISEKIDFSVNYFSTYNIDKNSLQASSNNNYFTHVAGCKINWMFWKGFVLNTSLQNTYYTGLGNGYNQNVFLWNAFLGYKFLKDKSLELKASVNDILNQNSGISRNITSNYVEDSRDTVLKRYMLFTLTYTLKFFNRST